MPPVTRRSYRPFSIDLRTSQGRLAYSAGGWSDLPMPLKAGFSALSAKMQQAGLFPAGPRQSGYTLFMQMSRAALSVYPAHTWTAVPAVPAPPAAPPPFRLAAARDGARTRVFLAAAAFPVGCQVWVSRPFVPGCRDPFAQRLTLAGALPGGWPDGGADVSALLDPAKFQAMPGAAFVLKVVPVSVDGFVGPSLSEMCIVGE